MYVHVRCCRRLRLHSKGYGNDDDGTFHSAHQAIASEARDRGREVSPASQLACLLACRLKVNVVSDSHPSDRLVAAANKKRRQAGERVRGRGTTLNGCERRRGAYGLESSITRGGIVLSLLF